MPDQPFAPGQTYQIEAKTGQPAGVEYIKLRDESRTNTVAFANDDTFVFPIGPGTRFAFQAVLQFQGNNPGAGKLSFFTPAAPVAGGYVLVDGGVLPVQFALATGFNGGGGFYVLTPLVAATDIDTILIWGEYVNGVNGGEFSLQWAQNALNATATILMAGSRMTVWQVSP